MVASTQNIPISVVMPVHNGESYLAPAIESILQQTHQNFEFIIVNDSSTDATQNIIETYEAFDSRIVVVCANARSVSGARNAGIAAARHAYIAFMDADDVAFMQRLEKQLEAALRQPEVVVWGAFMQCITDDNQPMQVISSGATTVAEFRAIDRTRDIIRCYGTIALFKRDVLEMAGQFDAAVEPAEDSEMWDRMAEYGPVLVVPEVLQYYRQHSRSASVTKLLYERKWQTFIKERYRAKLHGHTLSAADYDALYRNVSPLQKLDDKVRSVSQLYSRRYKIARAKKRHLQAGLLAGASVLVHPGRFLFRR